MSIFGALYAAVSGLNANSNALGIISDNISNSNTVGYKETGTDFKTLVTASGAPNLYSPGGVQSAPMYNIAQQGVLQAESSPTDLAISGGGFFAVNSSAASTGSITYTRAGNFTVDANGNLVNAAGFFLQGQPLTPAEAAQVAGGNDNVLTTTSPSLLQTVNVANNAGTAQATSNVSLIANLPADDVATPETMTVPVYDTLGVQHQMTLTFTPTATPNQWKVGATFTGAGTTTATIAAGDNLVQFNTNGTLNSAGTTFNTGSALSIAWDPTASAGTSPQTVSFNLGNNGTSSGLSQIGSAFNVGQINQDGVQFGNFSGVTINASGIVTANYDNGLSRAIYILPISTFSNPDALQAESGNTYLQTPDSGNAVLRQAGTGAAGAISPSSLENSTVDIATEFSNLIVTQRAYEANSKIITTADQMLETLIQAKQ
jgi:flagellar hook protein FlgE